MSPEDFIRKNIIQKLKELDYQGGALQLAADEGIAHYRRCSQASKRGAMFDDCFHVAKVWMDKYGGNTKAKLKRRGKTVVKKVSLF
ncbi:hypothetical protein PO864_17835 [Providencia alcalifaciens]|uniref:Uncharacterized protein n=1 Tax=Providencia alcalifaciens 205/92 TaxID=1256988 RepID=A0AAV3M0I5_9GAMM|nr:hypothetical protein [Providencia alcalifaciens]EUD09182.1 hypothetical protein HMPREF1563_3318 [Providencia alcalifaciens 205/92]WGZ54070.1 hypothetical protein PO864_17835 [Providencia alcalifaciens]